MADRNDGSPNLSSEEASRGAVSRRAFLAQMGAASAVVGASSLAAQAESLPTHQGLGEGHPKLEGMVPLKLRVNGKEVKLDVDPRTTLLDCLRENIQLTGTKKGCDHGQCGACTIHINGRRAYSCLCLALVHEGDEITTIEGIGQPDNLHPMQAAFLECDGYQCGYCTSGQIMSAVALLKEPCGPKDSDVRELMSGNICRCGAYPNIISAIQKVRGNT